MTCSIFVLADKTIDAVLLYNGAGAECHTYQWCYKDEVNHPDFELAFEELRATVSIAFEVMDCPEHGIRVSR